MIARFERWWMKRAGAVKLRARRRFLRPVVETLEARELLALITVTRLDDAVGTDDGVTLREAILAANTNVRVDGSAAGDAAPAVDAIQFQPDLAGTIALELGQLVVTETVVIIGNEAGTTIIDAQGDSRVLDITGVSGEVTLANLTLTRGKTTASGEDGGGIRSATGSPLKIQNSTISGNSTAGGDSIGGGIFALGPLTVVNSTIDGNSTSGLSSKGGGIFSVAGAAVTNSTISGNFTTGGDASGGGLYGVLAVTFDHSTITGNSVEGANANGGGIFSFSGPLTIRNSIVAGNHDFENGSHPELLLSQAGTRTIQNSLIGDGTGTGLPPTASLTDANGNRVGSSAAPINPRLGPLEFRGGPTKTHSLLPDSLAIDGGDINFVGPPDFDQRGTGFAREKDGPDDGGFARIDIGAFEFQSNQLPGNLTVDTTSDLDDGNYSAGNLSLREAIVLANLLMEATTIVFVPALDGQPIRLVNGQLRIDRPVSLQGRGAASTIIDGQGQSRLLEITTDSGDVTVEGLTLTGGRTTADSAAGGAIRTFTGVNLTIRGSTISGNSTVGDNSDGGGIFAFGSVTIANSTISGNATTGNDASGGGIFAGGALTVTSSTISGNSASGARSSGGGTYTNDALTIVNSTITGNRIEGNNADGGGLNFVGSPTISNSIVSGNQDLDDDSHPNLFQYGTGTPNLRFSLIGDATGTALAESNPVPDLNGNIIGGKSTGRIDARLGPLEFNGGPTQTHRLLAGSPALDAGSNDIITQTPLETDQRGAPRIVDGPDLNTTATADMGAFELSAVPFALVVTTADDELDAGADANDLSLREAIGLANGGLGSEIISFDDDVDSQPIRLTLGQMTIGDELTIVGRGVAATIIDGQGQSRLFDIVSGTAGVTFDELTLTGGRTTGDDQRGGAIRSSAGLMLISRSIITGNSTSGERSDGGGVYSYGPLTVLNSTISGNSTTGRGSDGGGIYAFGSLTLTSSTIRGNFTTGYSADGGGASVVGLATITNSTISGNSTSDERSPGGGIYANSAAKITNSTISGNSTAGEDSDGGGIYAYGNATVTNSTISGNSTMGASSSGGGIYVYGELSVVNSTITANSIEGDSSQGGGIASYEGTVIHNSIVAGNHDHEDDSHPDVYQDNDGTLSVLFSLIGDNNGTGLTPVPVGTFDNGNIIGTHDDPIDPQLGGLIENGGPTRTHRPLTGSPVIDAGEINLAKDPGTQTPLLIDQRGLDRIVGNFVDMGAVEVAAAPFPLVVTTANDEQDLVPSAADLSLREAIILANGGLGTDTITFAAGIAGQPILLDLGQMTIGDAVTIRGLGLQQTKIDGQFKSRLLSIAAGAGDVTLEGMYLTFGKTTAEFEGGGAIRSETLGQLTIRNSLVADSETAGASSSGGGVLAFGPLEIDHSSVAGNHALGAFSDGGGIAARGPLAVIASTISGNQGSGGRGGGILAEGGASVVSSAIFSNLAGDFSGFAKGGGIFSTGELKIVNSTISGNSAAGESALGGGIYAFNSFDLLNSTLAQNFVFGSEADGGGAYSYYSPTIRNSIIAGNVDGEDASHPSLMQGDGGVPQVAFSLIDNAAGTDLVESNPGPDANGNKIGGANTGVLEAHLGPLEPNFKFNTPMTHSLCTGEAQPHPECTAASPALDAGSNLLIAADAFDLDGDGDAGEPLPLDQRGAPFGRAVDMTVDMGAHESRSAFFWHNFSKPFDVRGGNTVVPDGFIDAGDALAIINYINAFDFSEVPEQVDLGLPFGFLDTNRDNNVAPDDALEIINAINAGFGGEGEGSGRYSGWNTSGVRGSGSSEGESGGRGREGEG